MVQTRTDYANTCQVTNTDTGKTVTAEILKFSPERVLEVSLDRSITLVFKWQQSQHASTNGFYIGSMAGMEFTSHGPEETTYRLSR